MKSSKAIKCSNFVSMAGPAGIEPALKVLETSVLPLYEGPMFLADGLPGADFVFRLFTV